MERTDIEQWKGREVARLLALVETERRYYQEMVATLPVALAVLASNNVIVSANRAFRDTFGIRPDQIRRLTLEQLLPSEELLERIHEARQQSQQQPLPQPNFSLESENRLFRISIVSLRNWDDETELETLLMVTDVSDVREEQMAKAAARTKAEATNADAPPAVIVERAFVEQAIVERMEAVHRETTQPESPPAQSAEKSALMEQLPAVVWTADATKLAFREVSASAKDLLGYPAEYWIAKQDFFSERIHPEDRETTMTLYNAAIEHKQAVSAEFRVLTAAGSVIWCRESICLTQTGVAGVMTEIGPRKQMEQQRIMAERHAALQTLSAQLSHDLNNPLMIITGYAEELLHTAAPNDPRRGDLEQILNATIRIASITSRLLQFTRRPETTTEILEVARMLRELKDAIERTVGNADLVYLNTEEPLWALANKGQLEEIILALVAAVHSSPTGKVAVTCGMNVVAEQIEGATLVPGTYAAIEVRNDGVRNGSDSSRPKQGPEMFESILLKEAGGPSALALPQAYALVHAWGGELCVTGDLAKGTCITVNLPMAEPPAPVAEPMSPEAARGEAASGIHIVEPPAPVAPVAKEPALRETILVVDDEPGIRALVAKILRRERYDVMEAGSAEEAVNVAKAHGSPVQLLLTDVMLPDRSGRQVAEQLNASITGLKVLYISGFTDDESVRAGEFPPGSRFLQKPFTVGALVSKVREALD
jgi:PAS domain S-box-containing protein